MKLLYEMEDHEYRPTAIKIVEALVDDKTFELDDLKEIRDYLDVYINHNE